jgi:hypothetical protein
VDRLSSRPFVKDLEVALSRSSWRMILAAPFACHTNRTA